jgi:DNA-binding beta-propeller fold protein YncE
MQQSAVRKVVTRAAALAVVAGLSVIATAITAESAQRSIGDIQVFTTLGYPGHPGGLAVNGRTLYVSTSNADFDRLFDTSDEIWAFRLDSGDPVQTATNPIVVPRQAPAQTMGLLGMALDTQGRLYVADMNGRVLRVDPATGLQEVYGTIPTNTDTSFTDMPGFVVFDAAGNLYVSDWSAPIIWRVPPGGGQAQLWFTDPRLAGTYGANVAGIALDPSGQNLYITAGTQEGQIAIYRLPLAHPDALHLQEFHRYTDFVMMPCDPDPNVQTIACALMPTFGAGGIAFGASGRLYVALFAKQQLSILNSDGSEALRFPSAEENMMRDVPIDGPFAVAFDGRGSLLVANTGDATIGKGPGGADPPGGLVISDTWVVFDVFVNDTAGPIVLPFIP